MNQEIHDLLRDLRLIQDELSQAESTMLDAMHAMTDAKRKVDDIIYRLEDAVERGDIK
jgi:hypothetical protein